MEIKKKKIYNCSEDYKVLLYFLIKDNFKILAIDPHKQDIPFMITDKHILKKVPLLYYRVQSHCIFAGENAG